MSPQVPSFTHPRHQHEMNQRPRRAASLALANRHSTLINPRFSQKRWASRRAEDSQSRNKFGCFSRLSLSACLPRSRSPSDRAWSAPLHRCPPSARCTRPLPASSRAAGSGLRTPGYKVALLPFAPPGKATPQRPTHGPRIPRPSPPNPPPELQKRSCPRRPS